MKWNDLIEKLIRENGGSASLSFLYENAHKYKRLPSGDWRKTLRGVLYRDVKRGRFIKVGLGVYAIPDFAVEDSAYASAVIEKNPQTFVKSSSDPHSLVQGMLLELGNYYTFLTYTWDKNKTFDGKRLGSIASLQQVPPFTYSELLKIAEKIDVIWFGRKAKHIFPKHFYEVEHSTDFTKSLLKMLQLKDFDARFILCSWEARQKIFDSRLNEDPFAEIKRKFAFKSFELIAELYFSAIKHFELESKYFES